MLLNKSQYERINENDTFLYIQYPLICFLFVVIFYIVTAYFDTIAPDKFAIFFFQFIIEDPWEIGQETVLQLHFRPPFTTTSKIQTALTRKFIQLAFQSNCEDDEAIFALKNPSIECETSKEISFKPINPAYEVLVHIQFKKWTIKMQKEVQSIGIVSGYESNLFGFFFTLKTEPEVLFFFFSLFEVFVHCRMQYTQTSI